MGPLLYLTLSSLRNRARVRLRRLKQPRYMIGMIVGLAYFWMVFGLPRAVSSRRTAPAPSSVSTGLQSPVELAGAAFLFLLCASAWIPAGRKRPALYFTQADVQFLFPAPVTRKQLIRYKLLRSQTGVLIGSMFMTVVFRPSRLANSWMFLLGMALTMTILNLYTTGVSLRRESLSSHGMAGIVRQWLPLAITAAAVIIVAGSIAFDWSQLSTLQGSDLIAELRRLATTGAAGVVMWPFLAMVRLPAAETPLAFGRALPWVLLIIGLSYIWVIRSDARFEEASAALADELADRLARIRKGQRFSAPKIRGATPTPFTLSLKGRAETAIFWKNLILLGRYASLRTLARLLPLFLLVTLFAQARGAGSAGTFVAWLCAATFVLTVLLGPLFARNDLRQDLVNLVLLKTWPIDGATLVRGEVMAPAVLLTVIAWSSAIGTFAFARGAVVEFSWVVAALLLSPGIIVLRLLAQNAIAVMFPSWMVTGPSRPFGIDVMGQRMMLMFGFLLVLVVAVVPAGIVGGLVGFGLYFLTGEIPVIVPSLAAAIVLFAESFVASQAVGKLLDRMDMSAIDAQE